MFIRTMLQTTFCLLVVISIPSTLLSQDGVVRVREAGGRGLENVYERVTKTKDGNYVASGKVEYAPSDRFMVGKYDTQFNVIWEKGAAIQYKDLQETADGGFIAVGNGYNPLHAVGSDVLVAKYDKDFNRIWERMYGGNSYDDGLIVCPRPDGKTWVIGRIQSSDGDVVGKATTDMDHWVFLIDDAGNILSQKPILSANNGEGVKATLTSDGGLLIARMLIGAGSVYGNGDIGLLKLDASLNEQWTKVIGGNNFDECTGIIELSSGGYALGGNTTSTNGLLPGNGTNDIFVMKTDAQANILWTKVLGGTGAEVMSNVRELPGGAIAIAVNLGSEFMPDVSKGVDHIYIEGLLCKFDPNGNLLLSRCIGGRGDEVINDVLMADNGNLVVVGSSVFYTEGGDFTNAIRVPGGQARGFIMELRDLSVIKGKVYVDANNNNVMDQGEIGLASGAVQAQKGDIRLQADLRSGPSFFLSVDSGRYVMSIVKNLYSPFPYDSSLYTVTPVNRAAVFTGKGQVDSFDIRLVPTSLVEDLGVSIRQLESAYEGNSVSYRIGLKNTGGKSISAPVIKLKLDEHVTYKSSTRTLTSVSGDTLKWQLNFIGGKGIDSIDVVLQVKDAPDGAVGDTIRLEAMADPLTTDLDTADNKAAVASVIVKQSAAISGAAVSIGTIDEARSSRVINYPVIYSFNSELDTTKGKVVVYYSNKSSYITATPQPSVVTADSLVWVINSPQVLTRDTIRLQLRIADNTTTKPGDIIRQQVVLQLNPVDTLLRYEHVFSHTVKGDYTMPDTITATLQPPHGILWSQMFGTAAEDLGDDVVALPDGGFIMTGKIGAASDALLARFDADGHLVWQKKLAQFVNGRLETLRKINDNTFWACGYADEVNGSELDALVVKFNDKGDILLEKTFGGSGYDVAVGIEATDDGGCVFTGSTNSTNGDVSGYVVGNPGFDTNIWVVKLGASGNVQWNKCYTDSINRYDAYDIRKAGTGSGYYVGGYRSTNGTHPANYLDGLLIKISDTGRKVWEKVFYHSNYMHLVASVVTKGDNSVTIAGFAGDNWDSPDTSYHGSHGSYDVWMANLDSSGNMRWQKYFGGSSSETARRIIVAKDGGYLIAASAGSADGNVSQQNSSIYATDAWLLKVDTAGVLQWQKPFGGTDNDGFNGVTELQDGSIVAVGYSFSDGSGDIVGQKGAGDALIVKIGQANYLTGKVFIDMNGNHVQDAGEADYNKGLVTVIRQVVRAAGSVKDGYYKVSMDTGTYQVKFVYPDSARYTVYPVDQVISFNHSLSTDTINFALVPVPGVKDLRIDVLPVNVARAGFTATYQLKYENNSAFPASQAEIKYVVDRRTTFLNSSVAYDERRGDTLVWKKAMLAAFESGKIDLQFTVAIPPVIMPGDSLAIRAEIWPIAGDIAPVDNVTAFKQFVGVAYDPNDKTEIHGSNFNARQIQDGDYLKYMIRFQNTGNDTAFNVYVRDTLSDKLDWNSLEMISASHDYDLQIRDGNKLEWRFNNILLADSNVNEPASHGFVAYRIKPRSTVLIGDTIRNSASIYFDFNPPVLTNTTISVISHFAILPVGMLSFEGKWKNDYTALLQWKVSDEKDVDQYVIQRSADGIVYEEVGRVKANNLPGNHVYEFTDADAQAFNNYYRIKILDADKAVTWSKTILLKKKGGAGLLVIQPNPTAGDVTLSLKVPVDGQGVVTILDQKGAVVRRIELGYLKLQTWKKELELTGLPAGQYYIQCRVGNSIYGGKLIKQ